MATKHLEFSSCQNSMPKDSTTDVHSPTSRSTKERGFAIQQLPHYFKTPKLLSELRCKESVPMKSKYLGPPKRGNLKKGTVYTGSRETSQLRSTNCNFSNTNQPVLPLPITPKQSVSNNSFDDGKATPKIRKKKPRKKTEAGLLLNRKKFLSKRSQSCKPEDL